MSTIRRFVRLFVGCEHEATYRERRPLQDIDVMHLVCEDCGHAVPVLDRTIDEHHQAVQTGAIRMAQARRQPAPAIRMARSRQRA